MQQEITRIRIQINSHKPRELDVTQQGEGGYNTVFLLSQEDSAALGFECQMVLKVQYEPTPEDSDKPERLMRLQKLLYPDWPAASCKIMDESGDMREALLTLYVPHDPTVYPSKVQYEHLLSQLEREHQRSMLDIANQGNVVLANTDVSLNGKTILTMDQAYIIDFGSLFDISLKPEIRPGSPISNSSWAGAPTWENGRLFPCCLFWWYKNLNTDSLPYPEIIRDTILSMFRMDHLPVLHLETQRLIALPIDSLKHCLAYSWVLTIIAINTPLRAQKLLLEFVLPSLISFQELTQPLIQSTIGQLASPATQERCRRLGLYNPAIFAIIQTELSTGHIKSAPTLNYALLEYYIKNWLKQITLRSKNIAKLRLRLNMAHKLIAAVGFIRTITELIIHHCQAEDKSTLFTELSKLRPIFFLHTPYETLKLGLMTSSPRRFLARAASAEHGGLARPVAKRPKSMSCTPGV